jgi:hypothetical protein
MAATTFYNSVTGEPRILVGSKKKLNQFSLWWEGYSLTIPRGRFDLLTPEGIIVTANAHRLAHILSSPQPLKPGL